MPLLLRVTIQRSQSRGGKKKKEKKKRLDRTSADQSPLYLLRGKGTVPPDRCISEFLTNKLDEDSTTL